MEIWGALERDAPARPTIIAYSRVVVKMGLCTKKQGKPALFLFILLLSVFRGTMFDKFDSIGIFIVIERNFSFIFDNCLNIHTFQKNIHTRQ